jgi:hypothetical protein
MFQNPLKHLTRSLVTDWSAVNSLYPAALDTFSHTNKHWEIILKNNSMDKSHSWEADSSSARHHISRILYNPYVQYRFHNSQNV